MKTPYEKYYYDPWRSGLSTIVFVLAVFAAVFLAGVALGTKLTEEKCSDTTEQRGSGVRDGAYRPGVRPAPAEQPWV